MGQSPETRGVTSFAPVGALYLANFLANIDESIYFKDRQSRFLLASKGCAALHGLTAEQMVGRTDFDLFAQVHAARTFADEQAIIESGIPMIDFEERESWHDRPDTWVKTTKVPLRDEHGTIIGTFGITRDITRRVIAEAESDRRRAEAERATAELIRVESQLRVVLDTASDAVALYDSQLRYQYLNLTAQTTLPQPDAYVRGRTDRSLGRSETFLTVWEEALRTALRTGQPLSVEFCLGESPNERWFQSHLAAQHDPNGGPALGVVASTREVSELKRAQVELAHQANHDPLTGLANRVLLMDRIDQALGRMERDGRRLAILFIDLDWFKDVNDTHGHDVGDRVLVEMLARLLSVCRQGDTVARLGGDEFVILLDGLDNDQDAATIAERAIRSIAQSYADPDGETPITASVGLVVADDPKVNSEALVRDADAAMYQAKQDGRNQYRIFDPGLRERSNARHDSI
jgi:diguanylate cyclase (GGDEF)-like protein/PAS domain S-box-containing protein